jgi:hypothetical protein
VIFCFGCIHAADNGNPLVLISQNNSTRAIALDSVSFTPEPFSPAGSFQWGIDKRTRLMLFALNLSLQPGDNASSVKADAEDGGHRHYELSVEYVGPTPSQGSLTTVILRLDNGLGDVGDVLVSLTYGARVSNRVRLGIGHIGGGPPDDAGALPTPARLYTVSGTVKDDNSQGMDQVAVTLTNLTNGSSRTVLTANGGNFSFSDVPAGYPYLATTPDSNILAFPRQSIDQLTSNVVLSFLATHLTYGINGSVRDSSGQPLAGALMRLTGGPTELTTTTDTNGEYAFGSLPAGSYFSLTPEKRDFVFTPATMPIYIYGNRPGVNFQDVPSYTVTGKVLTNTSKALSDVVVTLAGPQTISAKTAPDGSYSLTVTAPGPYRITPTIEQGYYNFSPAALDLNLIADVTVNFGAEFILPTDPFYVLEFDGSPKTVDYGPFWPPAVNLGHFFWEFWAMPGSNAGATYMLSDGYGGAHALLFGVANYNTSEPGRYELFGNINDGIVDGTHFFYFGSDQGPAVGEWGYFAVGWDGQNIITYYDGVPVGKTPFAGPRQSAGPGQGTTRLLIGGSDHNNFDGRIAQVRGYEDRNPREQNSMVEASFAPETIFAFGGNLLSYYFRPGGAALDLSDGYNGATHDGFLRGTTAGVLYDCGSCPPPKFVIDPGAPNFRAATAGPPVAVSSPAPVPATGLIYDSFGRTNSTYLLGGTGGLGSTEAGSLGVKVWQTDNASVRKPFGILNGVAVLLANAISLTWVNASANSDLDIRVDRRPGLHGSGISTALAFRVADSQNYFFAYTTGPSAAGQTLTIGYSQNGQSTILASGVSLPSTWNTLKVVTLSSGDIQVYADQTAVYATSSPLLATSTGAGLYSDGAGRALVNRWDNFTVYAAH